ncbi:putative zinc transporter ZIP12 [Apostichopus japonicus]|uniref:Putative zinc transporter ZIP12 n=1 Tax=Stichopus japonicus TaxID=307972 RepID=A0A2G8K7U1_STIJA|nr:putative zinc transporter ZIP12 [Apostichopus japonicus]PIK44068.1 putative zinc transporter ZIP12 [Apostichopus japonicus]
MVVMGSATDPFQEATDYLHALDEDIFGSFINMGQIQLMIDVFMDRMACQDIVGASTCYECLTTEKLVSTLGVNGTNQNEPVVRDIEQLGQAALILIYYAQDLNVTCNSSTDGLNSTSYEDIVETVCNLGSEETSPVVGLPCETFSIQQLNAIVEKLNETYQPLTQYEEEGKLQPKS